MKIIGAKIKYAAIVKELEEDQLYSPALIARFALARGLIMKELERVRVRTTLAIFARNNLPEKYDGLVTLRGNAPTPGWYGRVWQAHYLRDE